MASADPSDISAIVIGAGLSGLAAARALHQRGVSVRVFDKAPHVADAWRHRHPGLRLNTHRWLSSLPGLRMRRSAGAFPARDDVIRYLEAYADFIDVPIHLGITVHRVDPGEHSWSIETDSGKFRADHVIIATGRDRVPHIPAWPGLEETGVPVRHAADFGEVDRYEGKRVLVVGAGNSGTDVLNHLSTIRTKQVWVSVRHGPVVFPTRLLGIPVQLLSPVLERLPVPVVDRMLKLTERVAFGNLARWGLRPQREGGATRLRTEGTAPGIDNGFIRSLKVGRVEIVPAIEAFTGDGVRLTGGRSVRPDVVICATGYRTGLASFLGHLGILDTMGVPSIEGPEQDPRYPCLWFTGMRPELSGYFLAARRNASRIAKAIAEPGGKPVVTANVPSVTAEHA